MNMVPEIYRPKNHRIQDFRANYEFFHGISDDILSIPTGFEDISDNNDVYDEACGRVRNRVLTSMVVRMFSDCTNVVPVDSGHFDFGGYIFTFAICPSSNYVPEDYDVDIMLVVDDDLYVVEDYKMVPAIECFEFGSSFESIRDYMVRLLEAGF